MHLWNNYYPYLTWGILPFNFFWFWYFCFHH
jgi:hypothetical protein